MEGKRGVGLGVMYVPKVSRKKNHVLSVRKYESSVTIHPTSPLPPPFLPSPPTSPPPPLPRPVFIPDLSITVLSWVGLGWVRACLLGHTRHNTLLRLYFVV